MIIKKVKDKIELWFVKNDVKEKEKHKTHTKLLLVLENKKLLLQFYSLSDLALKW